MKVLFGSLPALALLEGGAKTQVLMLKKYMNSLGVEVELFKGFTDYSPKDFSLCHLFAAESGTYHLAKIIKGLGMKIVVSPIFYSKHSPFFLRLITSPFFFLRKFYGIWTEHTYVKEICEMADYIACNTEKEKRLITRGLGIREDKVSVIPNGVEERFYYAKPDLFIKTYGVKDFILYTGHICWARRNVLTLLKVLKRLRHPAVLIGKTFINDYGRRCLAMAKECNWIKVIDHIPNDSPLLESAYAAANVFCLPSLYETPGLSALEAGLAGAKIVITKFGGTEEYFKDLATYVNPYSEKDIERGIRSALAKKRNEDLREYIRKNFLWETAAEKLLSLYQKII